MKIIPKREAVRKESIVGVQGKGDVTCSCKGKCNTNHCSCKKEGRYRDWQKFQYGNLNTTVPELAEPGPGNGTTRIESSSSTGP